MFFGKKDKDVRLTDKQYKELIGGIERRQEQFRRDREDEELMEWLMIEDELDDM